LKSAIEAGNLDDMRTKKQALEELVQQMTVKLYEQASAEAQPDGSAEAGSQPKDDGVVDADFEEVDEDKKN
jgi:molecular chaperone DnaK